VVVQLATDHAQLFGSNLDLGQVVPTCFAIPLAVIATTVLFIQLFTKTGRRHNVDNRISHLLGDNLNLDDLRPVRVGDELQVDLRHEQQGVD
jgi:hypothetical protein